MFSQNPAKHVTESSLSKYLAVLIVVAIVLVFGRSCGAGGWMTWLWRACADCEKLRFRRAVIHQRRA